MKLPRRIDRVGRHAVRTAGLAALIVAGLLAVSCVAIDLVVAQRLTASVDQRLEDRLARAAAGGHPLSGGDVVGDEHDYAAPVVGWLVSEGSVLADSAAPPLPDSLRTVSAPVSAQLAGTDFRLAGADTSEGHLVVAQSLDSVSRALTTLVIAELVIGPLLLLGVFGGALAVGRRVALPVEAARRRQLAFTGDASHELRTPISVIEAETSLALSERGDPEAQRTALEHVAAESTRMRRIVEDLLWLARFDDEPHPPSREPIDVGAVAGIATERFRAVALQRGLQLRVEVQPGEAAVISAPPEWVDRLAGVLLDNACRYSRSGGSVVVSVTGGGNRVRLGVADSGPGIPATERERIFDRFHRHSAVPGGAGLGLAIGDAVVRATGGRWELESEPGAGSRFVVSWPRAGGGGAAALTETAPG